MPIYMGIFDKPNVLSKDLRGIVTAKGYEGWIELQGAALETTHSVATVGTGGQTGKRKPSEMVVYKFMDGASEALSRQSSWGTGKLVVIVFVRRATPDVTMVLRDTVISMNTPTGRGRRSIEDSTDEPMESLTLNFTQITYNAQDKSPDVTRQSLQHLSEPQWNEQAP